MNKKSLANVPKDTIKRIATVAGALVLLIGAIFLINIIMRGTGENERRIAEAVIASLEQKNIAGEFDISQQAQVQSMSATGAFKVQKHNLYGGEGVVKIGGEDGKTTEVPLEAIGSIKDSQIFVKVGNTEKIVGLMGSQTGEMKPMIDSIAKKINERWLHIPQKDDEASDCTTRLLTTLSTDKSAQKEATDAYIANRFIEVKDVKQEGDNTVYTVITDQKALKGFFTSIKSKSFFKKQPLCSASYDPMGLETAQSPQQQQPQQPQAQAPKNTPPTPFRIAVNKDGLLASLSSQQRAQDGVSTAQVKFSYQAVDPIALPTENIVEFDTISGEVQQIAGAFAQQQQQAAGRQQMPMTGQ